MSGLGKYDQFDGQVNRQIHLQGKNISLFEPKIEDLKDIKCVHPDHQMPIVIVQLDQNLKQNERFLCEICLKDYQLNQQSIGIQKAFALTSQNYQKKKELREIVLIQDITQLEQLINELSSMKTQVNQNLNEMMETLNTWINIMNQIKSKQFQFYDEIEWLIKYQQNIEPDQIANEIKSHNQDFISKLSKKLNLFCKFTQYHDCKRLLQNLSQDSKNQVVSQQFKQEIYQKQQQVIIPPQINIQNPKPNEQPKFVQIQAFQQQPTSHQNEILPKYPTLTNLILPPQTQKQNAQIYQFDPQNQFHPQQQPGQKLIEKKQWNLKKPQ